MNVFNIEQSSKVRGTINKLFTLEQDIYDIFNTIVNFMNFKRTYTTNYKQGLEQNKYTNAANSIYTSISRTISSIEKFHCKIPHSKDARFTTVIDKFNSLIKVKRPHPKHYKINMIPIVRNYFTPPVQSVLPDAILSAEPVVQPGHVCNTPDVVFSDASVAPVQPVHQNEDFNYNCIGKDLWYKILTEYNVMTNFELLQISWGKFKDLVPKEDMDITFMNLYHGRILLVCGKGFKIEWENKGWGKTWVEVTKIDTTRQLPRTRRLKYKGFN